ncbi:unnamed protein product [Closterium sp. NIES-54]
MAAKRHPKKRMVFQASVLSIEWAAWPWRRPSLTRERITSQKLELDLPNRLTEQEILVMTAEGGEPKWMPSTRQFVEVVLHLGTKDECRFVCTVDSPPSEEYDLLIGMELMLCRSRPSDFEKLRQPLTVVELFGGIGTGLAAVLKVGCRVNKRVLVEIEPVVHCMAMQHVKKLREHYPSQLLSRVEAVAEEDGAQHTAKPWTWSPCIGSCMSSRCTWSPSRWRWRRRSGEHEKVVASKEREEVLEVQVERQQQREKGWALMASEVEVAEGEAEEGAWVVHFAKDQREEGRRDQTAEEASGEAAPNQVMEGAERNGTQGREMQLREHRTREGTKTEVRWEIGEGMDGGAKDQPWEVLKENRQAAAFTLLEIGKYIGEEWQIRLTEEILVYQQKRGMSPRDLEICQEKCRELLQAGLIRPSESEYAAATVVVARKDLIGGILSRRMCGDYRDPNKLMAADRYPMTAPEEIFDKVQGSSVFTTLDLCQGFNQIRIAATDIRKIAFHGPDGFYEWLFKPFGLKNASSIFQRALRGLQQCTACNIDDVVVFSTTTEQHEKDVKQVLKAIKADGPAYHPKKCHIGFQAMEYLGFEVCGGQMAVLQAKVAVLDKLATLENRTMLRVIMGFLNYYMKLKARFTLYIDWGNTGIGVMLCQHANGEEKVVAFASCNCNVAEAS